MGCSPCWSGAAGWAVQPDVSIVVPTFNRAGLTCRAIESALGQTHGDLEVVAVDNHSSDGTWEALCELEAGDARVKPFRNDRDLGPVDNWRRGLGLATAEYVQLLFSDDWLEPRAVERLLARVRTDARVGFAYSAAMLHRESGPPIVRFARGASGTLRSERFLWGYATGNNVPVSPCGVLMRRSDALGVLNHGPLPIPDGPAFYERGIGLDSLILWRLCERYRLVFHETEALVNFEFGGTETSSPGITLEMVRSGRGKTVARGYMKSFGYFLATSALSEISRRRLVTAWYLRRVRLRHLPSRESWRTQLGRLSSQLDLRPLLADRWVAGLLLDRLTEWLGFRWHQLRGLPARRIDS